MSEPLSPELEAQAQELAARIRCRSNEAILEMARRLVAATDDTLFGDTEFALRDLPKKAATPPPPSTAPTADAPPLSTLTGKKRSRRSVDRSRAIGPTTTAAPAAKAPAPGTLALD